MSDDNLHCDLDFGPDPAAADAAPPVPAEDRTLLAPGRADHRRHARPGAGDC